VRRNCSPAVVMPGLVCVFAPAVLFGWQSQAPTVVLRSETRAVQINVAVDGKAGEPMRDLRKENFTLFDDGKPRDIQFFSVDADAPPSVGGVQAARGGSPNSAPRETVIILDCINTEFPDQSYVRIEALKAVGHMDFNESIAILTLAPGLKFQNFTRDRGALMATIKRFRPILPPYPMGRRVQVTLAALRSLAERLSVAPGRKSIVWITAGFPLSQEWEDAFARTTNRLNDANVALYTVDARGLSPAGPGDIRTLQFFADETGGLAFYNRSDIFLQIEAAIEDARSTYVIGFYLGDKERDRRRHKLKVEVDRRGAVLRYRRGYSPLAASRAEP